MKIIYLALLAGLMSLQAIAQLNEDFSDGDFTSSPSWEGDTHAWLVDGRERLVTRDTTVSQSVYLSTSISNSKNAKWDFLLQMNFDPSSANRIRIYLFSSRAHLLDSLNGYFLQVGESGPDDGYDLYRQDGLAVTRILQGSDVARRSADTVRCRFRITRDPWGMWELSADTTGGHTFISMGTVFDDAYGGAGHFGLIATYTPTRSGKFFFDDLQTSRQGPVTPPYLPRYGDLLINELMVDPLPSRGLPEVEYAELYNPGDSVISLYGWTWKDPATAFRFGRDSILPGEYLLLCHPHDTTVFSAYGRCIGISPFPTLNNPGDRLQLVSPYGLVVDSLNYGSNWYRSAEKAEGGWALERIASVLPCLPGAAWTASADPTGGTPGRQNVPEMPVPPVSAIRDLGIRDSLTLELAFGASPAPREALEADNYRLNNGAIVASAQLTDDPGTIRLGLETPLAKGRLYRLSVENITDCYGNSLSDEREFLMPQEALPGEVVINEILFNPREDGADFVEIYNYSDKILDISDMQLASGKGPDSLAGLSRLSDSTKLFYPGQYLVLSRYPERVLSQYFTENPGAFLKMDRFPAFNDDEGSCVLLAGGLEIDRASYREDMHFGLITGPEGVSLERTGFSLPPDRPGTFRSAAAAAGYATPGYRNSQSAAAAGEESIHLENRRFSPDGDGYEDLLQVGYRFTENNLVASVSIFDDRGYLVNELYSNLLLGTSGQFVWDGRDNGGALLGTGLYILYIRVFSIHGGSRRYKKVCVLERAK